MSVTKMDQVFPIKPRVISDAEIAQIVADALRKDFGDSASSIKHIGRVTNANLRAIKNWYEARNAPSSGHLLLLARSSSSILEFLLKQIGGEQLLDAFMLFSSKQTPAQNLAQTDKPSKIYSIKNYTINLNLPPRIAQRLNVRQLWFLSRLQENERVKAEDIAIQWAVSVASAKKDISKMLRLKLVRFKGAKKTGSYIVEDLPWIDPATGS